MTIEDLSKQGSDLVVDGGRVSGRPSRTVPTRDEIIEIGENSGIPSFARELIRIYDEQNLADGMTSDSS